MAEKLVMPKLGLSMTEGKIIEWFKKVGDQVEEGDQILEIETEKITNIIEAPQSGVILKVFGDVGDIIPIAGVLAYIGEPGENIPEGVDEIKLPEQQTSAQSISVTAEAPSKAGKSTVRISPAAKKLAEKLNVDYTTVHGTGPGGRISKDDIIAAGNQVDEPPRDVSIEDNSGSSKELITEKIPYSGMRKAIGTNMSNSWITIPKVTHHVTVDVTELLELRRLLNRDVTVKEEKITVNDLFVKIIAGVLIKFPKINCRLAGDEIELLSEINIGVAVSLDEGLVVPVVRNADKKDLLKISGEIKSLAGKARGQNLSKDEMSGATFTVSNIGNSASVDFFTPIINPPESAILGIGRIKKSPAVFQDQIAIRDLIGLSFAFDHRLVDGAPAAEFLAELIKCLENPSRSIL